MWHRAECTEHWNVAEKHKQVSRLTMEAKVKSSRLLFKKTVICKNTNFLFVENKFILVPTQGYITLELNFRLCGLAYVRELTNRFSL